MSIVDSFDKYKLIASVESSNSDEITENTVNSAIKEAADILKSVKKSNNNKLLNKFSSEYIELEESIKKSLINDRKISKDELIKIKLELWDIINLAEENNIIETTSVWSKLSNIVTWADNEKIKTLVKSLVEKNLEEYSKEDAIWALEYLNQRYSKYREANLIDKAITINNNSIKKLDDKYEVRIFQEKLINLIFWIENWIENWYNNDYLVWFSEKEKKWNYLVKISIFESQVNWQNVNDINSEALANYFKYLESNWLLTKEKLLNIFWENTLKSLSKLWQTENSEQYSQIAKKILKNIWIFESVKQAINFKEIFSESIKEIDKNTKQFTEEEREWAISFLKKEPESREEYLNKYENDWNFTCPKNNNNRFILEKTINYEYTENYNLLKAHIFKWLLDRLNWNKELAKKLIAKLKKSMDTNPCSFSIIKIFHDFNDDEILEYNKKNPWNQILPINAEEIKKWINDLANLKSIKIEWKIEELKLQIQIIETDKEVSPEEKKVKVLKLKNELNKKEYEKIILDRMRIISKNLKSEDITKIWKLIKKWLSNQEIINILRKDNKNLDLALTKYDEKYNDYFTEKKEINQKTNTIQETNIDTTNYNLSEKDYTLTSWGEYKITTPEGEDLIITKEEKEMTQDNPKALKNLINFHDIFKNLNMKSVWEYRNELIKWLGDVTVNLDENAITESELIKIWNKLLDFINNSQNKDWEWEKSSENTLWGLKNKLIKFSWANSYLNDEKIVNSYWDDPFKALLRNTWVIWKWYFKYNKFKNTINWKNKNGE